MSEIQITEEEYKELEKMSREDIAYEKEFKEVDTCYIFGTEQQ